MNSNIPAPKNQPEITPISQSDWKPTPDEGFTRSICIDEIIVDPIFQMRAEGTDPAVVDKYAAIMKENDPEGWSVFPEIKILEDTSEGLKDQGRDDGQWLYDRYVLAGFHRLEAMKKCGYDEIRAVMIAGNRLDGLILSAGENADRSQPRTNADIQNIVKMFLTDPELCQWNNAQIARWAQVDAQTVANHERRLLSTPIFDIDARPEKLKFVDKHGNISLRKRSIPKEEDKTIGDGLLINPKGEVVDAASVVNAELDAEQVEREQLQRDITNTFIGSIRPFIFSSHPTIFAQREASLIEEYPVLELYPRLTSLGLEDLRAFSEHLKKVAEELSDRKSKLRKECEDLYWKEITTQFPTDETTHEEDDAWKAALETVFPGYSQYQSQWSLSYYELADLKNVMLKIVEHLKKNGVDAYLPKSYTERITDEAKTESENAKQKELAKAVRTLREQVSNSIIKIADAEDESLSKRDMAVSILRSAFNGAQPVNALAKSKAMCPQWDMEELTAKEIRQIQVYWQNIKKVCAETPRPTWIDDVVRSFRCQLSAIKITGSRDYQAIGKEITIVPESPLSDDESAEVVKAAQEAAKEKAMDIHLRHTSVTEVAEPVDFEFYLAERDKAFKAWKAYCSKWGIEGNWESVCLEAEQHCGGEGSASLITESASPDLIREKAQFWQKLLSAIENEPDWIYAYRKPLAGLRKDDEEVGPDQRGLKAKIYDLLDEGNQPYAPELAHVYSVPVADVESLIAQVRADVEMEAEGKRKKALMDEYDDLSSEVQHLWGKHLKRFISWDRLCAAAQSHWMALENAHDYGPADESEESLKLQIGIWKNFKADLEYAVRVINNEPAERGDIWLLKMLDIKPEQTEEVS